jgi:hypothetical protein
MTIDARPLAANAPEASEAVEKPPTASSLDSGGPVPKETDQGWQNRGRPDGVRRQVQSGRTAVTSPLQLVGNDPTTELTVAEAAASVGVSPTTIRRRLNQRPGPDGRRRVTALPHAHQDHTGVWKIPVDDLELAQFKSGTRPRSSVGKSTIQVTTSDGLRGATADPWQRATAAETVAAEARRELTERLAEKDETIRTIRATVEAQSATIVALSRELEEQNERLTLMEKQVEEPEPVTSAGLTRVVTWEASAEATDLDASDPVPVGELRRRLADRQPPPRRWWQRIGRA